MRPPPDGAGGGAMEDTDASDSYLCTASPAPPQRQSAPPAPARVIEAAPSRFAALDGAGRNLGIHSDARAAVLALLAAPWRGGGR